MADNPRPPDTIRLPRAMTPEEVDGASRRACAAWWSSFGGSENPDSEWEGLDESDRAYWRYIAIQTCVGP